MHWNGNDDKIIGIQIQKHEFDSQKFNKKTRTTAFALLKIPTLNHSYFELTYKQLKMSKNVCLT